MASAYESSQRLIRGLYTSRVHIEDAFIRAYDLTMPAHENHTTWRYTLRSDPSPDSHLYAVGCATAAALALAVLSGRWLLAYSGSRHVARVGAIFIGVGLLCGPVIHDFTCYLASSDRRRGVAWNFFSEQGRRRPWLKLLNAVVPHSHFCKCLLLFLSMLYMAREAFSVRQWMVRMTSLCRLFVVTCTFGWVCVLEGMEPRPCRTLLNHWLHVSLNLIPSIITVHWAHASIARQFGLAQYSHTEKVATLLSEDTDDIKKKRE